MQFSGRSERRPELEDGRWKFPILENPLEGSGIGLEVDVTLIGHVIAETANRQIGKIHCKIFEISLYFFNFYLFCFAALWRLQIQKQIQRTKVIEVQGFEKVPNQVLNNMRGCWQVICSVRIQANHHNNNQEVKSSNKNKD